MANIRHIVSKAITGAAAKAVNKAVAKGVAGRLENSALTPTTAKPVKITTRPSKPKKGK